MEARQLALCVVPEYDSPRFVPGMDVHDFIRELSWAAARNRVRYEFACASGWPTVPPPSLIGEARRALAYAQLVRRFPATANIVKIVRDRREPVSTVFLATSIGACERTARNYARALENVGVLARRSERGGWMASERWN